MKLGQITILASLSRLSHTAIPNIDITSYDLGLNSKCDMSRCQVEVQIFKPFKPIINHSSVILAGR